MMQFMNKSSLSVLPHLNSPTPGINTSPAMYSAGQLITPSLHAALTGRATTRRRADCYCCVPSGCVRYVDDPIDPADPGDAVHVVCSNEDCVVSGWMHLDCFDDWEHKVLFYVRCCERGRDTRQRSPPTAASASPLAGYELAVRACVCLCGKGTIRRDLRHISTGYSRRDDVTEAGASLLYCTAERQRTYSFSSSSSGSVGSAPTPPLSPPRPQTFFPANSSTPPPLSTPLKPAAFNHQSHSSCSVTPGKSFQYPSLPSSSCPVASSTMPTALPCNQFSNLSLATSNTSNPTTCHTPARGNIFRHRADLSGLKSIRRSAQNSFHIRLDDDGPHGNDDIRSFLMRRLSAVGVREMSCVSCRCQLPVYDEFPLVDGTLFLSPRSHDSTLETDSIQRPAAPALNTRLSIPVVYNRRLLYLHAVCLSCLGTTRPDAPTSKCVAPVNNVQCRYCHKPWTVGQYLVLGTMYMYDVLACAPCCAQRQACSRCGGQPVGSQFEPMETQSLSNFSDFSRLTRCRWCSLEDYHFVKPFDQAFVCTRNVNM